MTKDVMVEGKLDLHGSSTSLSISLYIFLSSLSSIPSLSFILFLCGSVFLTEITAMFQEEMVVTGLLETVALISAERGQC